MTAIDAYLDRIRSGVPGASEAFAPHAVLDATVPHWRFSVHGAERVHRQLDAWFADPGEFEELERTPLPDGELVRFFLVWNEDGVPHGAHQTHILRLEDGKIASDTMFCGGRWPASLLAEMQQEALETSRAR